ncbi:protein of unknown function [Petrocella atlantisensis]|uniref:Uncharacterized protein n=1 Tax=Petrocella atlantisensis TaxID=2173034 RepID=A0A3P7PTP7_9FIRM|nr:protein of unknown function [Petrocella atlantisensis]
MSVKDMFIIENFANIFNRIVIEKTYKTRYKYVRINRYLIYRKVLHQNLILIL